MIGLHKPISRRRRRNGFWAITPLLLLIALFVGYGFLFEVSQWGLVVVFLIVAIYALVAVPGLRGSTKVRRFLRGATHRDLLIMIWIFVLAGAFTESARAMGAVDATVNLALHLLPPHLILAGLFLAACFISLSMGTSVGTIVALVPVADGLADRAGLSVVMMVAAVVGGAFFGDNLSFISDTTIMATRTQGCSMRDKFRVNVRIVLPAALLTLVLYVVLGSRQEVVFDAGSVVWLRVVPYLSVLLLAAGGINVLVVLLVGCLLTGGVGLLTGSYGLAGWGLHVCRGVEGMAPLITVSLLAGGLLNLVKHGGGIVYLMRLLTRRIHTRRGAEYTIAGLVSATNLCTANNTIAILSVGHLARGIAQRFGVDPRKSAGLLDTFSCCVQGLIPYGAQLMIASGLAGISPVQIIPYLYYPLLMGVMALAAIYFRYPRKYSGVE